MASPSTSCLCKKEMPFGRKTRLVCCKWTQSLLQLKHKFQSGAETTNYLSSLLGRENEVRREASVESILSQWRRHHLSPPIPSRRRLSNNCCNLNHTKLAINNINLSFYTAKHNYQNNINVNSPYNLFWWLNELTFTLSISQSWSIPHFGMAWDPTNV